MATEAPEVVLAAAGLRAGYGNITAIDAFNLEVRAGEVVVLLGPNGAGKSTVLRALSGVIRPWAGTVTLEGRDVTGWRSDQLVQAGMAHVPEGRQMLPNLTVAENLALGGFTRRRHRDRAATLESVLERFGRLRERYQQKAGTLSGGEQQMLAIGRALMAKPRILLLDEPSLGLAPTLVKEVFGMIGGLARDGLTILLVEQNVRYGLASADRGYVLAAGRTVNQAPAAALLNDPTIVDSYLGTEQHRGEPDAHA